MVCGEVIRVGLESPPNVEVSDVMSCDSPLSMTLMKHCRGIITIASEAPALGIEK
jgi:hypothetical protein